ncbi:type I restriction-modification system subunit M [Acidaminococcus timonensis]|uniref:type I restriction-modification system subunit M n=1 Tax=Acidaminococcus timonensis TaxID=1871002 RepID=UPI0026ECB77C|nr:type I restriction-modification system subunit M [Acidaminococcus timonensis]
MNKQQLAAKIWESANKMRSKIEANEYKDYILGFIFYKFLSEQEERFLLSSDFQPEDIKEYVNEDDPDTVEMVQNNLGYFIAYKDLFSTWLAMGTDFTIDNVRTALSSFTRLISQNHRNVFEGIFNTLETGLSKLGENTRSQTKAVRDLIQLIKDIPMDGKQDYDVLGFIYEYLISQFAANAGKKAGEFYTPHEVSVLMSEIIAHHLQGRKDITIYDPTSGSGSLLINIGRAVSKYMDDPNGIRYYAQELKQNTYNLTRMNLVMRGILPDNIVAHNADTLEKDWPYFDDNDPAGTYDPLYLDAVVSNPPYSQQWDPTNKENDPRYSRYGLAPKSKADYAFLLHDLYHLRPDGIMNIVLPHGVLFRGGEEGTIRKNLVEYNNIDAIIGLPANIFFGTGIPTIIMVLRQKRENTDVLIIDASKGFAKEGKNNKLRACDIRKIVDTVIKRQDVPHYARKVSREEIRANDYNLNIPRYVDSAEPAESWDIYATMFGGIPETELASLQSYWDVFPSLKDTLFSSKDGYATLRQPDIRSVVRDHADVKAFVDKYTDQFADFPAYLEHTLIDGAETLSIAKTEDAITGELFRRYESIPLIDRYAAYELFYNQYQAISGDLEILQQEGMAAATQVDPLMVIKKKNGKEEEVQEGWKGHIFPFDLVQNTYLKDELQQIEKQQDRLQEIPDAIQGQLEELSEDEKETISPALNDANDAFVPKAIPALVKELKVDKTENAHVLDVLQQVEKLNKEEKQLKSQMKNEQAQLVEDTRKRVEALSPEEVHQLLVVKWITPLTKEMQQLPEALLDGLIKKLEALEKKYETTLEDVESQIQDTEQSLCQMLGDLTGSDTDMAGVRELQKLLGGK